MSIQSFNPWPSFSDIEIASVTGLLKSGKVNYWTGSECREFEREFAQYFNCEHAISVANGTVALDLALRALGIGKGDEVIVTPRTFLASVSSIINSGAKPVFADVDPDSQNITPETVEPVLSSSTRAIMCVHLGGWICEMEKFRSLANQRDLFLIEDCAQSHGAKLNGKHAGSFGDIAAWSFCQDKIMTTGGEGGMVGTANKQYRDDMWSYKDHGKSWEAVYEQEHESGYRWLHDSFGTNWRMMEFQAVLGRYQLTTLNQWTQTRQENAEKIWSAARSLPGLRVPKTPNHVEHAAYKCYIFVNPEELNKGWNRDRILAEINSKGVPAFTGSCPEVYLEKAFDGTGIRPHHRLPTAKYLGETALMFMVHPTLTDESINQSCSVLSDVMRQAAS